MLCRGEWSVNDVPANAAEWVAREAGMWNFECKTRSPSDLPDTAESWHRCSVASNHRPLRALDTTAHFERAQYSQPVLQR